MTQTRKERQKYTVEKRIEVLALLEKNNGNIAEAVRLTGVGRDTIRRWRDDAKHETAAQDLRRFQKDAWEIIHRANEVVRGSVAELSAKDAASIAAGYFDRQARAAEQIGPDPAAADEYVAEWGGESNHRDTETQLRSLFSRHDATTQRNNGERQEPLSHAEPQRRGEKQIATETQRSEKTRGRDAENANRLRLRVRQAAPYDCG